MEFDATRPIWLQVMNALEMDIITGKRRPGEKLPGGRDLALSFGINPNTAARVYQELEKAGLCETRRGMGTFVTGDEARIAAGRDAFIRQTVREFLDRMALLGETPRSAAQIILREEE
ncbi:MAG: GntR family transcriptional regulator [Clostridia bacterium]|nr:GntR family transcriptional regulator [Clostridia bacterium]MBR0408117.1 GntR family transcriptional regulator [Clostridia bacterium]